MTVLTAGATTRWRFAFGRPTVSATIISISLLVLIGIEIAVLGALLGTTLDQWWTASSTGDFGTFYNDAKNLDVNGLYSPGLSLILYPLTALSAQNAYRVYVALGGAAVLGIAYIAQRYVSLPEGKAALVLGIVSIPQLHWALRLGHFTPILALVALGGFMLVRKRPLLAGLCFAFLVLKPQYAVVPALYLVWTRNWRALVGMTAGVLAIELLGFVAVGFDQIGPYISKFFDLSADTRDNLLPYQRSWQYAWQGFLISAGIEPHPLVVIDLSVLSLGVVVVAWARGTRTAAIVAAALGMLLVTPYANFYDWGMIAIAGVLLLQSDFKWKAAVPLLLVTFYFVLLLCQYATPFPAVDVQVGVVEANGQISVLPANFISPTNGIYWITPLALAAVAMLAMAGRSSNERDVLEAETARPATRRLGAPALLALSALVVPAAFFASAYYGEAPPFDKAYDPYAPSEIQKRVPNDFPLPDDAKLVVARQGVQLPFHLEWTTSAPVAEVGQLYDDLLQAGTGWELMLAEREAPSYRIRIGRTNDVGFLTHWAKLDVSPGSEGSIITLDLFVTQFLTVTSRENLSGN